MPLELPLADSANEQPRRADSVRNRRRILAAAAALVEQQGGMGLISMQDVAAAARVGTGTLYRCFGDRAGLAHALLDEHSRQFQNALISGPPPLGPGASPRDRLRAFGVGYVDLLERHAALLDVAESTGRNPRGPQQVYASHLAILLRDAAPHLDAEFTAQALLASLSPRHHLRLREAGWSLDRLRSGWCGLVDSLSAA